MTEISETRNSSLEIGRAAFRNVTVYDPNLPPCRVDLSDNTNLWGAPPSARAAVEDVEASSLTRYPAPYTRDLTAELAKYLGVDASMVVAGCGSDDLLDAAIRAFANPGDTLAHMDPTFGMIPVFGTVNGLKVVPVPLESPDLAQSIIATDAQVTYLCSPNNPTAGVLEEQTIESIVARSRGIVIIDEAYAEFAKVSSVALLTRYDNLLITRTLSKAFGLAGLRIGYAAGARQLVREVEKSRGPYKVSSLAEKAAIAAVSRDVAWMRDKADAVTANREQLAARLTALNLKPLPSRANFLLVPVPNVEEIAGRLAKLGIAARTLTNLPNIGGALRITVGPWPMMEEFLVALEASLQ